MHFRIDPENDNIMELKIVTYAIIQMTLNFIKLCVLFVVSISISQQFVTQEWIAKYSHLFISPKKNDGLIHIMNKQMKEM